MQRFVIQKQSAGGLVSEDSATTRLRRSAWPAAPRLALAPRRSRGHYETLESRTLLSVSTDSQGFTVVTPSVDSRLVYVSASIGDDNNDGLSPATPVFSVAKARTLVRSGFPDEMLLRRGDTFFGQTINSWGLSGRSATEPFVIGAYTDPAAPSAQRPKIASGIANGFSGSNNASTPVSNLYILGVAFEAHLRNYRNPPSNFTTNIRTDQQGGTYGINVNGPMTNFLVEDCSFQYYRSNMVVQSGVGAVSNVRIRRNVIADAYMVDVDAFGIVLPSSVATSEGIYAEGVNGLTIDGNVLSHNGWADNSALGSIQTIYNHGAYLNAGNSNVVFTGNIVADSGSHGVQARAGGIVTNNVFLRNPIAISYGYVNGSVKPGGVSGEISNNVVIGSASINGSARGWGLELANLKAASLGGGTLVRNNIFSNDTQNNQAAIKLDVGNYDNPLQEVGINDLTLDSNIVYSWARGIYIHPFYNGVNSATARVLTNLVVKNNDFQRISTTAPVIDHQNPFVAAAETWLGNRYDSTTAESSSVKWFKILGSQLTFAQWQAQAEPTAIKAAGLFPDPGRTAGGYNATAGGTNSTDAFIAEALKQSGLYWRPKYTNDPVTEYVRAGYAGGRVDASPPTASAATTNINVGGSSTYNFTVAYSDDNQVSLASLGSGDVLVTGPNGFSAAATLVSSTSGLEGNRRVATYSIAAPGGQPWSSAANGLYTLAVQSGQVLDASGKSVGTDPIGTFSVTIDPAVPAAFASAPVIVGNNAAATVTVTYTGGITPSLPTSISLANAGFETPNVGSDAFDAFVLNPNDGAWTYTGSSFISGNNSGFTSGNASAPQGIQVAVLQGNGSISQSSANWLAGTYTLSLQAAQRANLPSNQDFQVLVDGVAVATFNPPTTAYALFTTPAFTVPAGSHSITIAGLNTVGGDNSVFIDDVRIAGNTTPSQQLISPASFDTGDLQITSGAGVIASAASVAVPDTSAGTQRVAIYTFPAPAGGWSSAGNGSYAINTVAAQVLTSNAIAAPAARIGTLSVAINAPSAFVTAGDISANSSAAQVFTITYVDDTAGVSASIDSFDVRVIGPAAFNSAVTLLSMTGTGIASSPLVATYAVNAPAAGWSAAGNGLYGVVLQANQVTDSDGNSLPAGIIGTFRVAVDVTPPIEWALIPPITTPQTTNKTIGISYYDASGLNIASFDNLDLRVTGPNGYDQPLTKNSVASSSTATYVNYLLAAPAGGWKSSYNGTYNVVLQPNQVTDSVGNADLIAKTIATFSVALETIPPTVAIAAVSTPRNTVVSSLAVSFSEQITGFDLADLSLTRDGAPVSLTSATLTTSDNINFTLGNLSALTTTSGNYLLSVNPTGSGVADLAGNLLAVGATSSWLTDTIAPTASASAPSITLPSGNAQTITVNFGDNIALNTGTFDNADLLITGPGGYAAFATFISSTGSNTSRSATYTAPAPAGGWRSANNGTYVISLQSSQVTDTAGNAGLAGTIGTFTVALETTPPTASATAPAITGPGANAETITVSYADNAALNNATFDGSDIRVTGPNGYSAAASFISTTGTGTAQSAIYTVSAPAGGWKSSSNGTYTISLQPGQVADTAGNVAAAGTIGTFSVALETTAPTVSIAPVTPNPRSTPFDAVVFNFSEPISGFDLSDVVLTRDGTVVSLSGATLTSSDSTNYSLAGLTPSTSPAGAYVVTLNASTAGIADPSGNALSAGASTTVNVASAFGITDGGFENPQVGAGNFQYAPTSSWTFGGGAGITGNGSGFSGANPDAPQGTQAAFIQSTASISQLVGGFNGGAYSIALRGAQRAIFQATSQLIEIRVDGSVVGSFRPAGAAYVAYATPFFTVPAGIHTLAIVGLNPDGGDNTAFVDDVRLVEPAPVATIAGVTTPRSAPVDSVAINFSKAVSGFDLADLALTLDGSPVSLAGATLVTTDNIHFTLGNLSPVTTTAGGYTLTLSASGSGIADAFGTTLTASASTSWTLQPVPTPVITLLSPSPAGGSAFSQPFTLSGSNFSADASVTLRNLTSGQVFPAISLVSQSATQLVVNANFGSTASNWTAEVIGSTGSSGQVAFNVTDAAPLTTTGVVAADGKSASLSVTGAVGNGLSYLWSTTNAPAGAAAVVFSTGNAASTTATFAKAGSYTFQVTISQGATTQTASVSVVVGQQLTAIVLMPTSITLSNNGTQQFAASATDQFAQAIASPAIVWSIATGGIGTISVAGLYTAPSTGSGSATVKATSGSVSASAAVTVQAASTFTSLWIDFVPASAAVGTGFQRDGGSTYASRGNGFTYGWNISHTDAVFDRNKNSNQLIDTSIGVKTGGKWELAVANGKYQVLVGVGDSSIATTNTVRVEGTTLYSAVKQSANIFSTKTVTVTVTDGKLTIDAGSAANLATRLTYMKITKV